MIEEKRHIEVHIWENYLIFANILGISDKVKEQFNKIYPNFNIINTIFDVSFDNTLVGLFNSVYKGFKRQYFVLIVSVLLVLLVFLDKRQFCSIGYKILTTYNICNCYVLVTKKILGK